MKVLHAHALRQVRASRIIKEGEKLWEKMDGKLWENQWEKLKEKL